MTSSLHMIELRPDLAALLRFLRDQGLEVHDGDEDLGYGIHAWLAAAFGELAPKPWRLFLDRRRPTRILGYSSVGAEELQRRLLEFSPPGVVAVCPDPDSTIVSKQMPTWSSGRRLAFELQCCPVGRKAKTGVEKDLFLIRTDEANTSEARRDEVYCEWVRDRLQSDDVATVVAISLAGFRLLRQTRQGQRTGTSRKRTHLTRPHALIRGEVIVNDPDGFNRLLGHGVGRHRSFGYGMLLLGPAS